MFKRLLPVILVLASPAWAGISYYVGDVSAFNTAAAGLNLNLSGVLDFSGVNTAGVSFAVSSGFLDITSTVSYTSVDAGNYLQINAPTDVYAIGLYLSKGFAVPSNWNYASGSIPVPTSPGVFFGVISDTPLTSLPPILLTAQAGGAPITLQNFVLGTQDGEVEIPIDPSEAPEASSMMLMGGSLLALAVMVKRRRQQSLLVTAVQ